MFLSLMFSQIRTDLIIAAVRERKVSCNKSIRLSSISVRFDGGIFDLNAKKMSRMNALVVILLILFQIAYCPSKKTGIRTILKVFQKCIVINDCFVVRVFRRFTMISKSNVLYKTFLLHKVSNLLL